MVPLFRRFLRGLLIISLITCCLGATFFLSGNNGGPLMRWDKPELRIYDKTDWPVSMRLAVRYWNSTGIDLPIRLVHDPSQADVIARADSRFASLTCQRESTIGCADIGLIRLPPWQGPYLALKPPSNSRTRDNGQMASVAAHEIGHLLGLMHQSRSSCQLMAPAQHCQFISRQPQKSCPLAQKGAALGSFCPQIATLHSACRPSKQDLDLLLKNYGGQAPKHYRSWCTIRLPDEEYLGWCLAPNWIPAGLSRPQYLKGSGRKAHCDMYQAPSHIRQMTKMGRDMQLRNLVDILMRETRSPAQLRSKKKTSLAASAFMRQQYRLARLEKRGYRQIHLTLADVKGAISPLVEDINLSWMPTPPTPVVSWTAALVGHHIRQQNLDNYRQQWGGDSSQGYSSKAIFFPALLVMDRRFPMAYAGIIAREAD